jgi:hypothetical protein
MFMSYYPRRRLMQKLTIVLIIMMEAFLISLPKRTLAQFLPSLKALMAH